MNGNCIIIFSLLNQHGSWVSRVMDHMGHSWVTQDDPLSILFVVDGQLSHGQFSYI